MDQPALCSLEVQAADGTVLQVMHQVSPHDSLSIGPLPHGAAKVILRAPLLSAAPLATVNVDWLE
jgi:hypothetical protein